MFSSIQAHTLGDFVLPHGFKYKLQSTLEQAGFELHGSIYTDFSIDKFNSITVFLFLTIFSVTFSFLSLILLQEYST